MLSAVVLDEVFDLRLDVLPAVGVHDLVQCPLGLLLEPPRQFVRHVPQPMHPPSLLPWSRTRRSRTARQRPRAGPLEDRQMVRARADDPRVGPRGQLGDEGERLIQRGRRREVRGLITMRTKPRVQGPRVQTARRRSPPPSATRRTVGDPHSESSRWAYTRTFTSGSSKARFPAQRPRRQTPDVEPTQATPIQSSGSERPHKGNPPRS